MKTSLRVRYFYWLLFLLIVFMAVQTLVYGVVEIVTMAKHPELNVREQLKEVVMGVGLDLLLLPLLALLAWWISRRMLRSIRMLAITAGQISSGQLDKRVEAGTMPDDEMRMLADVLNQAFDRYQSAVDDLDRFTGDASHQLRTPLASIRATAEVALSGRSDAAAYRDALGSILEDVAKLAHLVDQLLAMARLGTVGLQPAFTAIDIGQLLQEADDLFRPACRLLGVELEVEGGAECAVRGNPELLMEALRNLLDNAMKHVGGHGRIRLAAVCNGRIVEISVMDTGPGVAPDLAGTIFDRHRRGQRGAPRVSGLGLALVRAIMHLHGGGIRLAVQPGWGAVFIASLPACRGRTVPG